VKGLESFHNLEVLLSLRMLPGVHLHYGSLLCTLTVGLGTPVRPQLIQTIVIECAALRPNCEQHTVLYCVQIYCCYIEVHDNWFYGPQVFVAIDFHLDSVVICAIHLICTKTVEEKKEKKKALELSKKFFIRGNLSKNCLKLGFCAGRVQKGVLEEFEGQTKASPNNVTQS
jgi:hypothetical protein